MQMKLKVFRKAAVVRFTNNFSGNGEAENFSSTKPSFFRFFEFFALSKSSGKFSGIFEFSNSKRKRKVEHKNSPRKLGKASTCELFPKLINFLSCLLQWVADGSPSKSTPIKVEDPNQFVPLGTSKKEFKKIQKAVSSFSNFRVNTIPIV